MGLRALQLMGLGRPALESELGRKSTDFRARKRSRAHLKRTDGAFQRTVGRRFRGKKPAERSAGPDRRSGARRSAQAHRGGARQAEGASAKRRRSSGREGPRCETRCKSAGPSARADRSAGGGRLARAAHRAIEARLESYSGPPCGSPSDGPGAGCACTRTASAASRCPRTARPGAFGADLSASPRSRRAALGCKETGATRCGARSGRIGIAGTTNRPSRAPRGSAPPW